MERCLSLFFSVKMFVFEKLQNTITPLCQVLDTFFRSEIAFLRSRFSVTLALHFFMVKFLHLET